MTTKDLISIIIPVYNSEKYLNGCIESVLTQSYDNIEIILVDDGSTDNSPRKCDEWADKDKRIKVIHKKNGGVSAARNIGIKNSLGRYLMFVDSDDKIADDAIKEMYNIIGNKKCDIVIGGYYAISEENDNILEEKKLSKDLTQPFLNFIRQNYVWEPWGKLVDKSKIDTPFDEKISILEDYLFWSENRNIKKYEIYDGISYIYLKNNLSITHQKNITQKTLTEFDAIKKIISDKQNQDCIEFFMLMYFNKLFFLKRYNEDNNHLLNKYIKENRLQSKQFILFILKNNNIKRVIKLKIIIKYVYICLWR